MQTQHMRLKWKDSKLQTNLNDKARPCLRRRKMKGRNQRRKEGVWKKGGWEEVGAGGDSFCQFPFSNLCDLHQATCFQVLSADGHYDSSESVSSVCFQSLSLPCHTCQASSLPLSLIHGPPPFLKLFTLRRGLITLSRLTLNSLCSLETLRSSCASQVFGMTGTYHEAQPMTHHYSFSLAWMRVEYIFFKCQHSSNTGTILYAE